jgi:hypothetical protein
LAFERLSDDALLDVSIVPKSIVSLGLTVTFSALTRVHLSF